MINLYKNTCGSYESLESVLDDGWILASEPPNTDRTVRIMWDDWSFGSLGFFDSKAEIPEGPRIWWAWSRDDRNQPKYPYPTNNIVAWRDL